MMKKEPRFKNEKVTLFVLFIGKLITMIILIMLIYPFILFLARMQISQETWFLYFGGTVLGILSGKIKLSAGVNKRITIRIILLSFITILLVVNLLRSFEDKTVLTILGLLIGIPTYTSIKYHFRNLEEEIKEYYHDKDYKHSL